MDPHTLFIATALVLAVFSVAFVGAFHELKDQTFWRTWTIANISLALCLALKFIIPEDASFSRQLPLVLLGLSGIALFWKGAREFNGHKVSQFWLFLPLGLLAVAGAFSAITGYQVIYSVTPGIILSGIALAVAYEYSRKRATAFSSRSALSLTYLLAAVDFITLSVESLFVAAQPSTFVEMLAPDALHGMLWLVFALTNGAFSLAVAFERKLYEQRQAAIRDPLTGAFNRREMMHRLEALLEKPNRRPFSFLLVDLDHFKSINDRFGHDAGDEVLQHCVDMMQWSIREKDCLARLGGEEFAVLMPNTTAEEATKQAEKIRHSIAMAPMSLTGHDVHVTLSAGVYTGIGKGLTPKQILRAADKELYRSKHAGRNQVSITQAA
ncbi:GGDEF domain-containing protein [Roseibium sp. CAU 1637]|uniref:diguanylate cyclase n=1 Tax=Roseibium limicola TaxID=2816037 RepID=A0A939EJ80_9HYPH|nr:GGDEF domain-containing protein [Roseibium limicola]MBO0343645.1 GGDEF domain-containing protein [Roseibium limicola]